MEETRQNLIKNKTEALSRYKRGKNYLGSSQERLGRPHEKHTVEARP